MAARPRQHNVVIPNLYCKLDKRTSKVYWQYRHPLTNQFIGFGTNESAAKEAAIEANRIIAQQQTAQINLLVDLAIKSETKTDPGIRLSAWIDRYKIICKERLEAKEIASSTCKTRIQCAAILVKRYPDIRLQTLNTKSIAVILDEYKHADKARMSQLLRGVWIDVFREAQHAGEVEQGFNPASATRKAQVKVRRSRLFLDEWKKIYECAKTLCPRPAANSMLLALMTGQRRGDIVRMKFSDVWDGHLHVRQSKTGFRIAIPTGLRCDALDMTLADAIAVCRDRVLSPYMIHHYRTFGGVKAGASVSENKLSKYFQTARDAAGIRVDADRTPPSFHEQRSLAERLYRAQGIDTQLLLGHKSMSMTDLYNDERGKGWKTLVL